MKRFASLLLLLAGCTRDGLVELRVKADAPLSVSIRPQVEAPLSWAGAITVEKELRLRVRPGRYSWTAERGPEFTRDSGECEAPCLIEPRLERIADLAKEGWWSGDLHVHRRLEDLDVLMRAADLHVAPRISWRNVGDKYDLFGLPPRSVMNLGEDRWTYTLGGEDERSGGAFLFLNAGHPVNLTWSTWDYPSSLHFMEKVRLVPGAWIDVEKPIWWDVPLALAHGFVDSVGLAHNHMWPHGMHDTEVFGVPRDRKAYPPPLGLGWWTQELYYRMLNVGLRIPPSAGSASGIMPNPLGYNRVYVKLDGPLTYEGWWAGFKAGRVFVTNGPLLRVTADGQAPGHVFRTRAPIRLEARLDGAPELELVQDGRVVRRVPAGRPLGTVRFDRSGWFLVRAVADVPHTFRFASTGPFYVELGEPRISRASARFFLDWLERWPGHLKPRSEAERRKLMRHFGPARAFWRRRLALANAE